jgi:hypothetical protein
MIVASCKFQDLIMATIDTMGAHIRNYNNPHKTTVDQIVENTSYSQE